jgi:hypothetical protein
MNRYSFTRHKPLDGSPDFWRLTVEVDGKTKNHATGNLQEYLMARLFVGHERNPRAEPIDAPPVGASVIFDLTARVAALEAQCAELRRLLSGVAPMREWPREPGPGWPLSPGPTRANPALVGPGSWVKPGEGLTVGTILGAGLTVGAVKP